jgi:hypothetical protein
MLPRLVGGASVGVEARVLWSAHSGVRAQTYDAVQQANPGASPADLEAAVEAASQRSAAAFHAPRTIQLVKGTQGLGFNVMGGYACIGLA